MTSSVPGTVRVNVVMRTRDRARLLRRAVDDVLAQSFEDWALTIVNDGGEAAVVDRIVAERGDALAGRVRVVHHEHSHGMEAASNAGIRARDSVYVAIHDDDDTWDEDFLALATGWLNGQPEAPAVAVRTEIVWESVVGENVVELGREVFLPDRRQITLFDLVRFNSAVPISMLYRRSVLDDIGLFDETLNVTGDWEANVRLAARGVIGFLDDRTLAYWHQRPGAEGSLGNSVIALDARHRDNDRRVRDRALRDYIGREGPGLPLYLTRFLDDRFDELRSQIAELRAEQSRRDADRPLNVVRRFRDRVFRRSPR